MQQQLLTKEIRHTQKSVITADNLLFCVDYKIFIPFLLSSKILDEKMEI